MESISNKSKMDLYLGKEEVLLFIVGFLISRVSISGRLAPFGIGFLGAYLLFKGSNIYVLTSVILGSISHSGVKSLDYIFASLLIYIVFLKVKEAHESTLLRASLFTSLVFLVTRLISTLLFRQFYMYDLFVLLFEGILVFTFAYIFSFSLPIEDVENKGSNNEKMICTFITLSLVLSGLSSIWFFGLSLKNIICIVLVVYFGFKQGVLLGSVSGCVLGLITYLGNPEMPFIVSMFAVGGLLSGLFRDLGKAGSLLGFMLGNAIISFYINKLGTSFLDYREIFISSIIFLLIAQFAKIDLDKYFAYTSKLELEYEKKKKKYVVDKLKNMSNLFIDLGKILDKAIEEGEAYSSIDVYNLVDELANKTCKDCKNFDKCWENDYYTTYYNLLNLIGLAEIANDNQEALISRASEFCHNNKEILIKNIEEHLLPFKNNQSWNKKLNQQRKLLADQLNSFGIVVQDLTEDIYTSPIFADELRELLIKEIKDNRIQIVDLSVIEFPGDNLEFLVEMQYNSSADIEKLKDVISEAIGYNLSADYALNNRTGRNIIKLTKEKRYTTLTDVISLASSENKVSGDSYSYGEIGNTNFIALSDGMGIGKKASRESSVAIDLLEKLMELNMDKSVIIRTINSFLRAKSNDEIFTTLDLGFLDLYTGKLQIIKNGSPSTFIKKKDRVDVISSKSLPVGILEDVDSNIYEEYLEDGDILIMMSDGVLDCNKSEDNSVEWMKKIIMGLNSQNPIKITEEIINIAKFVSNNKPKDDMTIMATKVWRTI
ncbi:MAG TPA: stage II sporulation protein E [Tissierellaceae bacterium]|nr:stage II sporulation protein E [Tissierellaceae bacterium]